MTLPHLRLRSLNITAATALSVSVSASLVLGGLSTSPAGAHVPQSPSAVDDTTDASALPHGELSLTDGDVVSYDATGISSYDSPELPEQTPTTEDGHPGATMGMYQKNVQRAAHLSPDSAESMTAIAQASGQSVARLEVPLAQAQANTWQPAGIQGMDVSGWQPSVNWSREYSMGSRFAYIKATEGTTYRSPSFDDQYIGSYQVGMIRGAYHFAIPSLQSSGATQADYFVNNGGGWSADGKTLPGLLDIEYNPYPAYGNICYNLTQEQMRTWIKDFSDRYKQRTGRVPAIYTTTDWWIQCTGNTSMFNDHPLHIARWTTSPGAMPGGWGTYDIWQYSETGPFSGDSNVFGGSWSQLQDLATNARYKPLGGRSPSAAPGPFRDVSSSHQFVREITWARDRKLLSGWGDGTFRPNQAIDRDAMAAVAYRMAGSPAFTAPARSPYRDVSTSHPFYREITWARSKGYLRGWGDGTFRPTQKITRDATAAMFWRMAGRPSYTPPARSRFVDVQRGQQFYREIHWFADQNITSGWPDGTYRPLNSTNRDAMAAFLHRYSH